MEEHAGWWVYQLTWSDADRSGSIPYLRDDRRCLLDRWLVVREFVVCGCTDDVCIAVLQPLLFQNDRQDIPGAHDHGPDIYHDPDFEHGDLPAVIARIFHQPVASLSISK